MAPTRKPGRCTCHPRASLSTTHTDATSHIWNTDESMGESLAASSDEWLDDREVMQKLLQCLSKVKNYSAPQNRVIKSRRLCDCKQVSPRQMHNARKRKLGKYILRALKGIERVLEDATLHSVRIIRSRGAGRIPPRIKLPTNTADVKNESEATECTIMNEVQSIPLDSVTSEETTREKSVHFNVPPTSVPKSSLKEKNSQKIRTELTTPPQRTVAKDTPAKDSKLHRKRAGKRHKHERADHQSTP